MRRIVEATPDALLVERMTDWGDEAARLPMPAVLTVLKDLNFPRLPSLAGQMAARRCDVPRWGVDRIDADAAQLGLNGSPTRVVRVFTPPRRAECVTYQGDSAQSAAALAAALRERGAV